MGKFLETACFALNGMGQCSALSETKCENCKFFKTKEQVLEERKIVIARLKREMLYKVEGEELCEACLLESFEVVT